MHELQGGQKYLKEEIFIFVIYALGSLALTIYF